jgi:two-component system chemotaxis response regulator CheB
MRGHDIVVIGTSAGGVAALQQIFGGLPKEFPAAIFVVMHLTPHVPSFLPQVLGRAGRLPATAVTQSMRFESGQIYIAPPDHHLVLSRSHVEVNRGPRENWHRPSIDVLFRSAANSLGPRVVGVVLTGFLDDGSAGLAAIRREGGITMVQDPNDAMFPDMPQNALEAVKVDHCVPLSQVGPTLVQLVQAERGERPGEKVSEEVAIETAIAKVSMNGRDALEKIGKPSTFTCPECQGPLWELRDGELLRFRCQVGHAFSSESMLNAQQDVVEKALWVALGAIQSRVALWGRISERMQGPHLKELAEFYRSKKEDAERDLNALRDLLTRNGEKVGGMREGSKDRSEGSPRPAFEEAVGSAARRPRARRTRKPGRSPRK